MKREELIEAIFADMQQLHRSGVARFHALMGEVNISPSQMELLMIVKHQQPISVKEIAAHMHLTPGAVTQLMEGLVSIGYLERHPDERDRRVTNVSLGSESIKKLKALWEKRKTVLTNIMQGLETEELATMHKVMQIMLGDMECLATTETPKKPTDKETK